MVRSRILGAAPIAGLALVLPLVTAALAHHGWSGYDAGICRNFDQERLQDAYEKGREVHRTSGELSSIDGEIRDINVRLEDKDKDHPLESKERDALMFRLGVLTVERVNAQRAYDHARYQAQNL